MLDRKRWTTIALLVAICLLAIGVAEAKKKPKYAGFLTDYSKLEQDPEHKSALFWKSPDLNPCDYPNAFLAPIEFHAGGGVKADERVIEEDQEMMKQYLYAMVRELFEGKFALTGEAGPDVLTVRIAITDLLKSKSATQVLPQTKQLGAGRGGAAMEGEMVDSQTGRVVAAVVQSGKGGRTDAGVKMWSHGYFRLVFASRLGHTAANRPDRRSSARRWPGHAKY